MKRNIGFLVIAFLLVLDTTEGFAQQQRLDAGTKILIPSSARTGSFTSFLAVINLDSQDNAFTVTARGTNGSVLGTPITRVLSAGGRFRSTDILNDMGVLVDPLSFGPITVESTNGKTLSAVSEVTSLQNTGGFFAGVNASSAWMQGYIAEVIDTGDRGGAPGTFRTNVGLNTVTGTAANVTVTLRGATGQPLGSANFTVQGNGLTQFRVQDSIPQLRAAGNGYLTISSTQPIHAWASKIENGTEDSSFQIGIGALAGTVISQVLPTGSDARNNLLFIGLALIPTLAFLVLKLKGIDLYQDESLARQTI